MDYSPTVDRVDIGVIGVGRPPVAGPLRADLRALAQGRPHVLIKTEAVERAHHRQDVVGERGPEEPGGPLQLAPLGAEPKLAEGVRPAEA